MCTGHTPPLTAEESDQLLGRRGLLKAAAGSAAAVAATGLLASPAEAAPAARAARVPRDRISIQLYTLRDQLAADLPGTIAALRDIGYRRVEHAGFHGRTAAQFKQILDDNGIRATSGHAGIPQPFDANTWGAALDDAVTLGQRYIVHPLFGYDFGGGGAVRSASAWQAFARDLNRAGLMARRRGISLGYHNHHHEFLPLAGHPTRTAFDVLTATTDRRYVHLEMDLFWVVRGGRDPVDLIARLGRRVRQFHVKDMSATFDPGIPFTDPGKGVIDFRRIFRAGAIARTDEFIVERDDAGVPPRKPADALTTARAGYEFLRNVVY
ncbi:sugar phosphate isomerase/epimerase family protein [Motilibacter deserti]|uniref:Sugar phosphate isomerase/epimerase n=1 Tax=Motilibacter deserti TaxID=2714956 RepID=A0ABX0GYH1_9ACTN|nr:sugar phosphate isomerase/epimerase [Motilibacter deserti]NHC14829.1 sugar phosphate isomerase/epimerase [Motilibacter deserti]